jgi:hypothetical protein
MPYLWPNSHLPSRRSRSCPGVPFHHSGPRTCLCAAARARAPSSALLWPAAFRPRFRAGHADAQFHRTASQPHGRDLRQSPRRTAFPTSSGRLPRFPAPAPGGQLPHSASGWFHSTFSTQRGFPAALPAGWLSARSTSRWIFGRSAQCPGTTHTPALAAARPGPDPDGWHFPARSKSAARLWPPSPSA